jgi:hypothetical protein
VRHGSCDGGNRWVPLLPRLSTNAKSVPFDWAQDMLREPQHERYKIHLIQNEEHLPFALRSRPPLAASRRAASEKIDSPFQERLGEVMKHSSTNCSDFVFSRRACTTKDEAHIHHLTLILSWEERKEHRPT